MKKLKEHIVNKFFYPVAAGIETNILQTQRYFPEKGWTVTVHTSKDTLTEKNVLSDTEMIKGIKVIRYPYGKFGFFPKIDWNKTDVVSLHNFNIFPHFLILIYSLFLKILGNKKFALILSPHGFSPDWRIFPKIQAGIKRFYQYNLGVFLINKTVDGIRAVSEWEKLEMIKHGVNPNLIKVINNGVEDEAFVNLEKLASKKIKEAVAKNKPYFIQVGRIHPIKNYENSIRALTKLPKNFNYLIVGPEQDLLYRKELENLIKKLELEKRVKFLGVVRGVDKYYLLKHAQLMVHMAAWESYCNAVHEGMSQGLVCIVSNSTALPFLIKDGLNGYCLNVYDHEALAEKIKFVLENENSSVIKNIQKRNIQFTKDNSWENVAKKIEQFYLTKLNYEK